MKLDSRTTQILRNFSSINPSIAFKPGKSIATISPTKTILARATVAQEFSNSFAIYDLSRFLSTLSLFNDPEIDIQDKHLVIKQDSRKINYTFAEPSLIVTPPSKEIKLPNPEVQFSLKESQLQELLKVLSVLSLPDIAVMGDGENITLEAIDSKNPTGDTYSINVGETTDNFKMYIKTENLKVISGDYEVKLSSKGLSHFKGIDVEYWIAVASNSTFG